MTRDEQHESLCEGMLRTRIATTIFTSWPMPLADTVVRAIAGKYAERVADELRTHILMKGMEPDSMSETDLGDQSA